MRAQKSILRSKTKTIKVEQRGLLGGVSKWPENNRGTFQ